MAVATATVVTAGAAAYGAYSQNQAAKDAARAQARGVNAAREDTEAATNRGRMALSGVLPPSQQQMQLQSQLDELIAQRDSSRQPSGATGGGGLVARAVEAAQSRGATGGGSFGQGSGGGLVSRAVSQAGGGGSSGLGLSGGLSIRNIIDASKNREQSGGGRAFGANSIQGLADNLTGNIQGDIGLNQQIADLEGQISGLDSQRQGADPRQDLISGIGSQMAFTDQGFGQAQNTLSPIAQMAQPYLDEQYNLLGMGGEGARQQALSRVSDPLAAEQERALARGNAAYGGVGGNVLSALAEQTRSRTEANIGNRLSQLGSASSPGLNALQQISNLQQNRGLSMGDIAGVGGRDLASQETARRQALANLELGQGSQLAQLSQNLGTAQAGGAAYAAQNPNPLTAGLMGGLNTYLGAGGTFGGSSGSGATMQSPTAMNVQNPNIYGNIA